MKNSEKYYHSDDRVLVWIERLELAWELKISQDLLKANEIIKQFERIFFTPHTEKELTQSLPSTELDLIKLWSIYLPLQSSIHRACDSVSSSQSVMLLARQLNSKYPELRNYYYYYETSQIEIVSGLYSKGLESSMTAASITDKPHLKTRALLHAMICRENLGFPSHNLRQYLTTWAEKCHLSTHEAITQQIQSYDQRKAFRSGNISNVFNHQKTKTFGQNCMYPLWVDALPYVNIGFDIKTPIESLLESSSYFSKRSFHLHTLRGVSGENDFITYKLSDMCDRFYLWVWRWLESPKGFSIYKILEILDHIDFVELSSRMTCEDSHLVANGLVWLSLGSPVNRASLQKASEKIRHSHLESFPILHLEYIFIDSYLNENSPPNIMDLNQPCKQILKEKRLYWEKLFFKNTESNDDDVQWPFTNLSMALSDLAQAKKQIASPELHINLYQASVFYQGKLTISEPLVKAILILKSGSPISFHDFLQKVYGVSGYNPIDHNHKIFNLLARVKSLTSPNVKIFTKEHRIFSTGVWSCTIIGIDLLPYSLPLHEGLTKLSPASTGQTDGTLQILNGAVSSPLSLLNKLSNHRKTFTRRSIAKEFSWSKSTTLRKVKWLLQNNHIEKIGQGPSTCYQLKQGFPK